MQYDSRADTAAHIAEVQRSMELVTRALLHRSRIHDCSKYSPDERTHLDMALSDVKKAKYGSPEYISAKRKLEPFLVLHYARNSHHPEHYADGIAGMDILDVIEMLCDWISANASEEGVTLTRAIEMGIIRFNIESQLASIITNTISRWPT